MDSKFLPRSVLFDFDSDDEFQAQGPQHDPEPMDTSAVSILNTAMITPDESSQCKNLTCSSDGRLWTEFPGLIVSS